MREQGNVKDGDDGRSRKYSIQIDPVVRRLLVSLSACPGVTISLRGPLQPAVLFGWMIMMIGGLNSLTRHRKHIVLP